MVCHTARPEAAPPMLGWRDCSGFLPSPHRFVGGAGVAQQPMECINSLGLRPRAIDGVVTGVGLVAQRTVAGPRV
jgi:hypothetical protein